MFSVGGNNLPLVGEAREKRNNMRRMQGENMEPSKEMLKIIEEMKDSKLYRECEHCHHPNRIGSLICWYCWKRETRR